MSISKFKIHRRAQFCYSSMIKIPQTMKVLYIFHPKRRLPWNVFKESGTFTILGFPTKKIAFFAWLWPIEAEMENKPSNCWLWLKAMMMKWKCTRTHLHKLSTELFAFRIPAISWNLISTQNATEDDLWSEYLTSFHISSISSQRSSLFRKMKLNCTALILIDNLHYFDVLCLCLQCILQAYRWRLCASACNVRSVMLRGDYMYALISQTHQRLNLLFTYCIFFTAWWLGW